jgi:hypothetical protein
MTSGVKRQRNDDLQKSSTKDEKELGKKKKMGKSG